MNPIISPEARACANNEIVDAVLREPDVDLYPGGHIQSLLDSKQAEIDKANGRLIKLAKEITTTASWTQLVLLACKIKGRDFSELDLLKPHE